MTTTVVSGSRTTSVTLALLDDLMIGQNGFLAVTATPVNITGFAAQVLNYGVITTHSSAAVLGTNVGTTIIQNFGYISAVDTGIDLSHSTQAVTSYSITNGGTISARSAVIELSGAGNSITNTGDLISGQGNGIVLGGLGAGSTSANIITNSGKIHARYAAISSGATNDQVTNYGEIFGVSINLGDGNNRLFNTGVISLSGGTSASLLAFGAGNDEIVNRGTITGNISLGDGRNTFDGVGGILNGAVYGGSGDDIYIIDTSDFLVSDRGGVDSVQSYASFIMPAEIESLFLIGTAAINGTGNFLANSISGNLNSNKLVGRGGNDVLSGGDSDDRLFGGSGNDYLDTGADDDLAYGGVGDDHIINFDGEDRLYGGEGNDTLSGGADNDRIYGDDGNDVISDSFGADRLYGGAGRDSMQGGLDHDSLYGGGDLDTLFGGDGNDSLYGGGDDDQMFGGADEDRLFGGDGNDTLFGNTGNDTLVGGAGSDVLFGGDGLDVFQFVAKSDSRTGALSDIIADYELGSDLIDISALASTAFTFLGSAAFVAGAGPQVRVNTSGGDTMVQLDVDGNGWTDMRIIVAGSVALSAGDFLL